MKSYSPLAWIPVEEADKIAEAASTNHVDITNELFDDEETELDFWDNSVDIL